MSTREMTREDKVAEFLTAAGKEPWDKGKDIDMSIFACLSEETTEFFTAAGEYVGNPKNEEFRKNVCKEWADLQYVLSQMAWYLGIPADPSFNRVHNNNMTKVVDGKVQFREDGKILKPEGYQPVDMGGL